MPLITAAEIGTGADFPPMRERARVERMDRWARYSTRRYQGLNAELAEDLRLRPNLFRWLMDFWRNAVVGDAPVIGYSENERVRDFIDALKPSLVAAMGTVVSDLVRYGTGVFVNRRDFQVQTVDPRYWYPVREAWDQQRGDVDVIAYPYAVGDRGQDGSGTRQRSFEGGATPTRSVLLDPGGMGLFPDRINVTVYGVETGVTTRYKFDGKRIGEAVEESEEFVGTPAVVPVVEGEGFYGESDFADAEEYVAELHRRESAVSKSLDRHTDPHLAVPEGVLKTDSQGRFIVNMEGMIIPVPEGSEMPQYIQWDARYEAQGLAMERAHERVLQFSAVAPVLVDLGRRTRTVASGAALRRLAIPTVNRIRTLRGLLNPALRQVIAGQAALVGVTGGEVVAVDPEAISIQWPAELSGGITDEADAVALLVESGVLERETAVQLLSKVSGQEAERIAEEGRQEAERQAGPGPFGPVPNRAQ